MNLKSIICLCFCFSILAVSSKTHFFPLTEEETAPLLCQPHQKVKTCPNHGPCNFLELYSPAHPETTYFTSKLCSWLRRESGQPASMPLPRAGTGTLPISPGTRLPLKRKHAVTLRQFTGCKPSWHWGAVILMDAGRKMEISMVMTGLDLVIKEKWDWAIIQMEVFIQKKIT